jgi:hypothetical protein
MTKKRVTENSCVIPTNQIPKKLLRSQEPRVLPKMVPRTTEKQRAQESKRAQRINTKSSIQTKERFFTNKASLLPSSNPLKGGGTRRGETSFALPHYKMHMTRIAKRKHEAQTLELKRQIPKTQGTGACSNTDTHAVTD